MNLVISNLRLPFGAKYVGSYSTETKFTETVSLSTDVLILEYRDREVVIVKHYGLPGFAVRVGGEFGDLDLVEEDKLDKHIEEKSWKTYL